MEKLEIQNRWFEALQIPVLVADLSVEVQSLILSGHGRRHIAA